MLQVLKTVASQVGRWVLRSVWPDRMGKSLDHTAMGTIKKARKTESAGTAVFEGI